MKTKKGKWPAILLALAMVLTMSPYMAFAADTSDAAEGPGACKLTEGCSLPVGHVGDCVLKSVNETDAAALQARIDALPDSGTLAELSLEEQQAVYAEICSIYDAIKALDEGTDALNLARLEAAADIFAAQVMPLDGETVYVAQIGDAKYESLTEAINAATSNDVITLLDNVDLKTSYLKFYDNMNKTAGTVTNLTLDLGGHTLRGSRNPVVQSAGEGFVIKNGVIGNYGTSGTASGVTASRGSLTLGEGLQVSGNIGVYVDPATNVCTITIDGASVTGATYGAVAEGPGSTKTHIGTANLIVKSGSVTGGTAGIAVYGADNANAGITSVVISGGTISGGTYGIAGNGNVDKHIVNTSIQITGGTVQTTNVDSSTTGIYHPQKGTLVVSGGAISGMTGIEIRAGELTVSGGSITGGNGTPSFTANGNGTTAQNIGIAVAQHTTKEDISVTINNDAAQVSGGYALAEADPQNNDPTNVTVKVEGGTFTGSVASVSSENYTNFITGGIYNTDPKDYVSPDSNFISYTSTGATVYALGSSIDTVLKNATAGDTVTVFEGAEISVPDHVTVKNETGNQIIVNGQTVANGGELVEHIFSTDWTFDGTDHWHKCTACDEIADKAAHTMGEWSVEKEATETEKGSKYRACTICGYRETAEIPALPHTHNAVKKEAKAATCTQAGNTAYWYCAGCGKYFSDETLTNEIAQVDTVIAATGHENVTKTEAKVATAITAGNIAYWYCADCGKYFSDEALTKEIAKADTVIAATGSTGTKDPTKPDTGKNDTTAPQTGDESNLTLGFVLLGMSAVGLAGTVICGRKRKQSSR